MSRVCESGVGGEGQVSRCVERFVAGDGCMAPSIGEGSRRATDGLLFHPFLLLPHFLQLRLVELVVRVHLGGVIGHRWVVCGPQVEDFCKENVSGK